MLYSDEVWQDRLTSIEVAIPAGRPKEEKIQIPRGDALMGSLEEVGRQLTRRGFTEKFAELDKPLPF